MWYPPLKTETVFISSSGFGSGSGQCWLINRLCCPELAKTDLCQWKGPNGARAWRSPFHLLVPTSCVSSIVAWLPFSSLKLAWGFEELERTCDAVTVVWLMPILRQSSRRRGWSMLRGLSPEAYALQKEDTEKYCNGLLKRRERNFTVLQQERTNYLFDIITVLWLYDHNSCNHKKELRKPLKLCLFREKNVTV